MNIETKKFQSFESGILDALQNDPRVKEALIRKIQRRVVEAFEESLSEVLKYRSYLDGDEIEISVSVEIGNPDEEEVELDTDEE